MDYLDQSHYLGLSAYATLHRLSSMWLSQSLANPATYWIDDCYLLRQSLILSRWDPATTTVTDTISPFIVVQAVTRGNPATIANALDCWINDVCSFDRQSRVENLRMCLMRNLFKAWRHVKVS